MKLTVLGSGTAVPVPHRGAPGYLLQAGGRNLLLDCGPGTLRKAAAAGVAATEIDGVLVTHFHPDHNLDVPALLFARNSPGFETGGRLLLAGPRGFEEVLDHWWSGPQGDWLRPRRYDLETRLLDEGAHELLGLEVEAIHVEHTPQSLAYRIRERPGGPVLAYSGDTTTCEGIVRAGRRADLFLLECARPDSDPWKGHLTPRTAAEIAERAAPAKLLLTHFYPEVEGEPIAEIVSRRYGGEVVLAEDGMVLAV